MTVEFTVVGGNGLISNELMGPIRRQTRGALVGHQQPSVATREALGSIRRQMCVEPVVHGYPVPGAPPAPSVYYRMRAWHTVLLDYVYWEHAGSPDYVGTYSGQTISDLSRIRLIGERQ